MKINISGNDFSLAKGDHNVKSFFKIQVQENVHSVLNVLVIKSFSILIPVACFTLNLISSRD